MRAKTMVNMVKERTIRRLISTTIIHPLTSFSLVEKSADGHKFELHRLVQLDQEVAGATQRNGAVEGDLRSAHSCSPLFRYLATRLKV